MTLTNWTVGRVRGRGSRRGVPCMVGGTSLDGRGRGSLQAPKFGGKRLGFLLPGKRACPGVLGVMGKDAVIAFFRPS